MASFFFLLFLEWEGDCPERLYAGIPSNCLRNRAERCHNAVAYAGNLLKVLYILFISIDVHLESTV